MSTAPIDILFSKAEMRCTVCNAKAWTCKCWERCSCGWSNLAGEQCNNPDTIRCSSKINNGKWCRRCRVYHAKSSTCPKQHVATP